MYFGAEPLPAPHRVVAPTPEIAPVASSPQVSEPARVAARDPGVLAEPRAVTAAERAAQARARQAQADYEAWAHREVVRSIEEDEARARRINQESQAPKPPSVPAGVAAARVPNDEALRRVPITMYSASGCGVCSAARSWLRESSIPFTERDVDTDVMAAQEARRLNPRGGVPTFDVGGTAVVGFLPSHLTAAIQQAARQ